MDEFRQGPWNSLRRCVALGFFLSAAFASSAGAGEIPFAGNRPQSYQFYPTPSYNTFGQFIQFYNDSTAFKPDGNTLDGAATHTFVGLSTILHREQSAGLNWIAFATIPEVNVQGRSFAFRGIGDPLAGGGLFINPTPSSTLGLLGLVQIPIGNSEVSYALWSFWPSVFGDAWFGPVNVDAQVGGILRTTTHRNGQADMDPGPTLHANLRVGYSLFALSWTDPWYPIPFAALDYQTTGTTSNHATGVDVANTDSNELALGGGMLFQLKLAKFYDQFEVHYSRGVSGKNTSVTNALLLQYWHYW
jgi:hypothetical protein